MLRLLTSTARMKKSFPDSPLAILAERAESAGYEPWLFHRDGWDWKWRSWGRVADHVARGVETLRGASTQPRRAGYDCRQHPDSVTVGLAIQAAGWAAVPVIGGPSQAQAVGCDVWVSGSESETSTSDIERIELPPVSSPIERAEPRPLVLAPESSETSMTLPQTKQILAADLVASAKQLDLRLPADRWPIVCAAPNLRTDDARLLEVWTLVRGAAWVLEPEASAFVETVLWARPTLVWGQAKELESLATRLQSRKHRRRSRLSAVIVTGDQEIAPGPWQTLGAEILTHNSEV